MTSTDELRRLLDERGVEYEANRLDFDGGNYSIYTEWGDISYVEYADGTVLRIFDCTPEQAIAAMLGNQRHVETCEVECFDDGVDEGMDGEWFSYAPPTWYLSCGHTTDGTEKPNYCPNCGAKVVRE